MTKHVRDEDPFVLISFYSTQHFFNNGPRLIHSRSYNFLSFSNSKSATWPSRCIEKTKYLKAQTFPTEMNRCHYRPASTCSSVLGIFPLIESDSTYQVVNWIL